MFSGLVAYRGRVIGIDALPTGDSGPPETGKVEFFDNSVDVGSGTIGLKAIFANAQQRLWPGQFVNVSMTLRVEEKALVVPQAAVQRGPRGGFVYVVDADGTHTSWLAGYGAQAFLVRPDFYAFGAVTADLTAPDLVEQYLACLRSPRGGSQPTPERSATGHGDL